MNARASAVADDVDPPDGEAPERSVRDELEAARDEIVQRESTQPDAPPAEEAAPEPAPRGERDASGRFAPKAGKAPAAVEPASIEAAPKAEAPAAAAAPTGPDVAPQSWSTAAKAEWNKLSPSIRAEINRREQEVHKTLTRQDEQREYGRQFAEISQQHAATIQRAGVHPIALYRDFLQIMNTLNSGDMATKVGLLRQTALQNGIDLRALAGAPNASPQPSAPQNAPQTVIPPHLAAMANEWNQFKTERQREAQEREQREQQQTLSEIMEFRSKPEAIYFDAVKDHMVALLQGGTATTLSDAYEQAIWARPDIRAQLIAQDAAKAQANAQAQRERAQRARARGGSIRGGSGAVSDGAPPNRSLREELQAGFAEARNRV